MKKAILSLLAVCLLLVACDNFFHDLIPASDDRIHSFKVNGQVKEEIITDNEISVYVSSNTDIQSIIPTISTASGSSVIPLTLDYIQAAFPSVNVMVEVMRLSTTNNLTNYVTNLVTENKDDFSVPAINMPIDFTQPVDFLVIAASGSIRQYTVFVGEETAELLSFNFAKYDNPELIVDAVFKVNKLTRTAEATVWYPAEMTDQNYETLLSFALIPSFEINGDSIEYDDNIITTGETLMQFNKVLGSQSITITITKGNIKTNYTLNIFFTEDPDTMRSITDFRFTRADNTGLISEAVASIVNSGDTGTITVQVLYAGSTPPELTARFVTPGTATVNNVQQLSGITSQDFSSPKEYRVLSKSGQFVRIYTARVEFISITNDAPRILSFKFPYGINSSIIADANGNINDAAEQITVQVKYSGYSAPDVLIPEFTAQGLVTVYGAMQISGTSQQDFSRQIRYTVTNPNNPVLKRDYMVQCVYVRDDSSDASITAFGFYPENNRSLLQILSARVDQNNGTISLFAPIGSGITTRVMVPQFSSSGQVTVNGALQRSGVTGRMFDEPTVYVVTSANGQNSRSYTVEVKELGTTIYVNQNAAGLNDGTSWQNAYISLKTACEAAAQFDRGIPKEIWIAGGTYSPINTDDYFFVAPNTTYMGGFAGTEDAAIQRNIAANPVIITGNPAKLLNNNIHAAFFNSTMLLSGENVHFEDIIFNNFTHNDRLTANFTYIPISLRWGSNAEGTISLKNCTFKNVNGHCIETANGNIRMEHIRAENIASMYTNNKTPSALNLVTTDYLNDVRINTQIQYGNRGYYPLFIFYGGDGINSTLTLSNFDIQNIALGTKVYGNNAIININNYEAKNINTVDAVGSDLGSVFEIYNGASIKLADVDINGGSNGRSFLGSIFFNEVKGNIDLTNVTVQNITVSQGDIYGGAGGICINHHPQYDIRGNLVTRHFVYQGGRINIDNVKLINIRRQYLSAFNIYRPDVDIYINDFTVETTGRIQEEDPEYSVTFESYRNIYMNKLKFKNSPRYNLGYFYFAGDSSFGEIFAEDVRAENGDLFFTGSNKTVTVTDVVNTISALYIATSNADVTVSNIRISGNGLNNSRISTSGVNRILSVTDAAIGGTTSIVGGTAGVIAEDITVTNDSIGISGSSAINIKNVFSTKDLATTANPNFSISGGNMTEITAENIKAWNLSVSSYKALSLKDAEVGRSTSFSSTGYASANLGFDSSTGFVRYRHYNFTHQRTEIENLKMLNPNLGTGFANNTMQIFGGIVNVKNSDFYVRFTEQDYSSYYSNVSRMRFNSSWGTNYTVEGGALTVTFTDCNFYDLSTYRYYNYQTTYHSYNFTVSRDAALNLIRCNFIYSNNAYNQGLIYSENNGIFNMDTVAIANYNLTAGRLFYLSYSSGFPNPTYRVRTNCSFNGQQLAGAQGLAVLNLSTVSYISHSTNYFTLYD
ncbi:MAG: hypothetical protein LBU88_07540 [Treponema sp.]|jgi:hypothetical protein|nr:hypothetical protein [Treponema sp.]